MVTCPVGTDAGEINMYPKRRSIEELINKVIYNFTPPEETALLDFIGIHDKTRAEIWDILAKQKLGTKTINRVEIWGGPGWFGGTETGELQEVTCWTDRGSYLVTVEDVKRTFEVPEGFGEVAAEGGMDWTMIIAAVVVVVVAAGGGLFVLKKRRSSASEYA